MLENDGIIMDGKCSPIIENAMGDGNTMDGKCSPSPSPM
jgi:hypothetical protein